jgi:hypothetical protein
MAFIKVVGMFDDRESLERARRAIIDRGLALEEDIRVEPDPLGADATPSKPPHIWQRLKNLLTGHSDQDIGAYAEGVRRGSLLLVVTIPEHDAEKVKQVLRENGAVELRRRVLRWMHTGWQNFDPDGVAVTEEEIVEERRAIAADKEQAWQYDDSAPHNIRLFDEQTGREIGRISEPELGALRQALEEEGPDDNDYWINSDEIDDIASRPGATPHLVSLLRDALRDKPDGIEIAFRRDGEESQTRGPAEGRSTAGTA